MSLSQWWSLQLDILKLCHLPGMDLTSDPKWFSYLLGGPTPRDIAQKVSNDYCYFLHQLPTILNNCCVFICFDINFFGNALQNNHLNDHNVPQYAYKTFVGLPFHVTQKKIKVMVRWSRCWLTENWWCWASILILDDENFIFAEIVHVQS